MSKIIAFIESSIFILFLPVALCVIPLIRWAASLLNQNMSFDQGKKVFAFVVMPIILTWLYHEDQNRQHVSSTKSIRAMEEQLIRLQNPRINDKELNRKIIELEKEVEEDEFKNEDEPNENCYYRVGCI